MCEMRKNGERMAGIKTHLQVCIAVSKFVPRGPSPILLIQHPWNSRGPFHIKFPPFECKNTSRTIEDGNFKCFTSPNSINNMWIGLLYRRWQFSPFLHRRPQDAENLLLLFSTALHIKANRDKCRWVKLGFCSSVLPFSQGCCITLSGLTRKVSADI